MTVENLLRCEGLAASYDGREIWSAVNLALGAGTFALQGHNGSGKSTLLRLLAGGQKLERGNVWIDGLSLRDDPISARARLSYAPDESPVYPFMTGGEFLRFIAAARRVACDPRLDPFARGLGLLPYLDTRFGAMSLGMQKKMLLCAAWLGDPRVILLDEPSNGLDVAARDCLAGQIVASAEKKTILYASHDADFVAATGASIVSMTSINTSTPL
jgi:ABC-2 type transport system ATP-binding protein